MASLVSGAALGLSAFSAAGGKIQDPHVWRPHETGADISGES